MCGSSVCNLSPECPGVSVWKKGTKVYGGYAEGESVDSGGDDEETVRSPITEKGIIKMEIQLQTILQPDMEICAEEELYFHRNKEEICFDGYFNLFYIEKWKRYTQLKKLQLSIKTVGYQMLRLYHNRECVDEIKLEESNMRIL